MAGSPNHAEVFERAVEVGEEHLDQTTLELASTSVIAGYTIVFGIAALGIVHAVFASQFPEIARVAGALAFGVGFVFLVVGQSELFAENVFDPSATILDRRARELVPELLRLWTLTLAFNLLGGALVVLVFSVEGALPAGTDEALATTAHELIDRTWLARFASAVGGGALVSLLSYFEVALEESPGSRIWTAYVVGVLLTIGPFDHVVVTVLHAAFALAVAGTGDLWTLLDLAVVSAAGNLVGGVGLVTTTHVSQALGAGADGGSDGGGDGNDGGGDGNDDGDGDGNDDGDGDGNDSGGDGSSESGGCGESDGQRRERQE